MKGNSKKYKCKVTVTAAKGTSVKKTASDASKVTYTAYKEENGYFSAPEDIMNVTGIGQKTFASIKDRIVV